MNNVIRWLQAGVQSPRSKRAFSPSAPSLTLTVQVAGPRPESEDQGRGKVQSSVCAYDLHAQATVEDFDQNPMPKTELVGSCSRRTKQRRQDSLCSGDRTYGWQAQPSRIQAGALAGTWDGQLTTTWRGDDCLRSASSSCSTH